MHFFIHFFLASSAMKMEPQTCFKMATVIYLGFEFDQTNLSKSFPLVLVKMSEGIFGILRTSFI